jgi:hypothetical protein
MTIFLAVKNCVYLNGELFAEAKNEDGAKLISQCITIVLQHHYRLKSSQDRQKGIIEKIQDILAVERSD